MVHAQTVYRLEAREERVVPGHVWRPAGEYRGVTAGVYSPGLVRAYPHPLLVVLCEPLYDRPGRRYTDEVIWECEGEIILWGACQVACRELAACRRIVPPPVTPEQRARFAIHCALRVYDGPGFADWARERLDGKEAVLERVLWVMSKLPRRSDDRAASAAYDALLASLLMEGYWRTGLMTRWIVGKADRVVDDYGYDLVAHAAYSASQVKPIDLLAIARRAVRI
jgi:hypothetical protein